MQFKIACFFLQYMPAKESISFEKIADARLGWLNGVKLETKSQSWFGEVLKISKHSGYLFKMNSSFLQVCSQYTKA